MFSIKQTKDVKTLGKQGIGARRGRRLSRLVAFVLSFVMAVSVIPALKGSVIAHADEPALSTTGDGTQDHPYQISSYAQLKEFADIVNGTNGKTLQPNAWAELVNDIDCSADKEWVPIGNNSTPFNGSFDGQDCIISNLSNENIDEIDTKDYQGLFGFIHEDGKVKNIGLENGKILGSDKVGSIAGVNLGSITKCYNTGSVSGRNCVGGVVGTNESASSVEYCYNTGSISGKLSVGGVVGFSENRSSGIIEIKYCYNIGSVSGINDVGGVVGENGVASYVKYCYNSGSVSATTNCAGGVVGKNNVVTSIGCILNCYNMGSVSGTDYVGGVIGRNFSTGKVYVENCYNIGSVSGGHDVGGVIGQNYQQSGSEVYINNCYYDQNTCGASVSNAIANGVGTAYVEKTLGLTTDKMTGAAAFNNGNMEFSFAGGEENPWILKENGEFLVFYPHLNGVGFEKISITDSRVISDNVISQKDWPVQKLKVDNTLGTSTKPYEISDYTMLKEFSNLVNGYNGYTAKPDACAVLVNDIICTDKTWVPIGDYSNTSEKYYGTFNGQNHKIANLSNEGINNINNCNYQGLVGRFGHPDYGDWGEIKNVRLESGTIKGLFYVGSVVGYNSGDISNCCNTGTVSGEQQVGGIAGSNDYGSINNCYNTGGISGETKVGGITGSNNGGSIFNRYLSNCYNTGDVSGKNSVGGIAGDNVGAQSIQGIICDCYNIGVVNGENDVGGVLGKNDLGIISNCYFDKDLCKNVTKAIGNEDDNNNVAGLTSAKMIGTSAVSAGNMVFTSGEGESSPWLMKAAGEFDGKNYLFYPHLKGFDKDENGAQLTSDSISVDKWPARAEVCVTWSDTTSFEYDKNVHSVDVTSVKLRDTVLSNSDYTVSYSRLTDTDEDGTDIWEAVDASDLVNVGTYKKVVSLNGGLDGFEKQFTITPKSITVTPDNITKTWGDPDPEFTYTVSGLIPGDVLTGSLVADTDGTIILGTLSNSNYSIKVVSGKKLTIQSLTLREDDIVLSYDETTYDGSAKTPDVKVYIQGIEYNNTEGCIVDYLDNVNAGISTVNVRDMFGDFTGTKTFTIKRAPVTVTANNITKTYGEATPELTYTVSELYGSDAFSKDLFTVSCESGEDAGTYAIKVNGDAAIGNYDVTYVPGTLTILQATPKYTVPAGLTAVTGQKLSDVVLPEGWTWENAEQSVGAEGTNSFTAVYTPQDTKNYKTVSETLSVTVSTPTQNNNGTENGGSESENGGTTNGGSTNENGGSGTTNGGSTNENGGSGTTNGGSTNENSGSGTTNGGNGNNNGGSGSVDSGNTGSGTTNGGNDGSTSTGSGNSGNTSSTGSGSTTGTGKGGSTGTGTTSGSGAGTNGTTEVTQNKDGSETKTTVTQNEDGSETKTAITTNKDGSEVKTVETKNIDGSKTKTVETKNTDGSETKTSETKNTDGSKVKTVEEKDADGFVSETTVKTNTDGSTETKEVLKDADDNVLCTTTETSAVDENKNVTVTSTTVYADNSSITSEVVTSKKGTVTSKIEYVEADGTKTEIESSYKKNGAGEYTSETVDADGNVISSTTSKTTVNKKKNTVTTTETSVNADGSKIEYESVSDKDGNTKITETVTSADKTVTTTQTVINADGTGTSTIVTKDAEGNEISRTEENTTISKKGTVKTVSVTKNNDGSTEEVTERVYSSGTVTVSKTQTDANGNTSEINETFKTTKKGNRSITFNKVDNKVGKKSTKTTTTDGKAFVYKSGKVKITLTVTKPNGKTKTKSIKLKAEDVDIDVSDVDEIIERYL